MGLSNDIWDRSRFCRGSDSEKSETGPIPSSMYSRLTKISFLSLLSSPSVSSVLTNNFLWTIFVGVFTLAHLWTGLCSTVLVGIWSLLSIILILSVSPSNWYPLILNSLSLYLISCPLAFNNGYSKLTYLSGWTVTMPDDDISTIKGLQTVLTLAMRVADVM